MPTELRIHVDSKLFQRDPEETDLGRRIIEEGVRLIDSLGIEEFTLKKLATAIDSTEASMYRYFENKHQLLFYLLSWYWTRLSYLFDSQTLRVEDPWERLRVGLQVVIDIIEDDPTTTHIDEAALSRIAILESSKVYRFATTQERYGDAIFLAHSEFSDRMVRAVKLISPQYPHPKALISVVLLGLQRQLYHLVHMPHMTDLVGKGKTTKKKVSGNLLEFGESLIRSSLA